MNYSKLLVSIIIDMLKELEDERLYFHIFNKALSEH